uniref:Uncharacterized protein n=1 Tax=Nelumbo nucifera TaxID=4432 RepID=A0A822YGS9_NELNU|nr:TPA_asm: hypothetical protein HUJ06_010493 [Nelumbo nucifera]
MSLLTRLLMLLIGVVALLATPSLGDYYKPPPYKKPPIYKYPPIKKPPPVYHKPPSYGHFPGHPPTSVNP